MSDAKSRGALRWSYVLTWTTKGINIASMLVLARILGPESFGVAEVSAYQARPSLLTAMVLNSGTPWCTVWASINSSRFVARAIAAYCSMNSLLSMLASR